MVKQRKGVSFRKNWKTLENLLESYNNEIRRKITNVARGIYTGQGIKDKELNRLYGVARKVLGYTIVCSTFNSIVRYLNGSLRDGRLFWIKWADHFNRFSNAAPLLKYGFEFLKSHKYASYEELVKNKSLKKYAFNFIATSLIDFALYTIAPHIMAHHEKKKNRERIIEAFNTARDEMVDALKEYTDEGTLKTIDHYLSRIVVDYANEKEREKFKKESFARDYSMAQQTTLNSLLSYKYTGLAILAPYLASDRIWKNPDLQWRVVDALDKLLLQLYDEYNRRLYKRDAS